MTEYSWPPCQRLVNLIFVGFICGGYIYMWWFISGLSILFCWSMHPLIITALYKVTELLKFSSATCMYLLFLI